MVDTAAERAIALIDDDRPQRRRREPLLDIALGPALLQRIAAQRRAGTAAALPAAAHPGVQRPGRGHPGIAAAAAAARRPGSPRSAEGRAGAPPPITAAHCASITSAQMPLGAGGARQLRRIRPRFIAFGELLAGRCATLGVDAALGPVPGEYCPGEFSINDGHGHKLVGTAQRLVRGGWLFGTVILVADPEPVREVLTDVYEALELDWDPGDGRRRDDHRPRRHAQDVHAAVLPRYGQLGGWCPANCRPTLSSSPGPRSDRHLLPVA